MLDKVCRKCSLDVFIRPISPASGREMSPPPPPHTHTHTDTCSHIHMHGPWSLSGGECVAQGMVRRMAWTGRREAEGGGGGVCWSSGSQRVQVLPTWCAWVESKAACQPSG